MKKVYKYPLIYNRVEDGSEWEEEQIIDLPAFSEVLHVNLQGDNLVCWAKVDSYTTVKHKVQIEIVGTGHQIKDDSSKYVNTFFDNGLVFHVFVNYGMYNEKV